MSHQLSRARRGLSSTTVNSRQNFDILPYVAYHNFGIAYSGSTFTSRGTSASRSSTNPTWVCFPSKATPGTQVWVSSTANETFVDDSGSSTIAGNTFGFGVGDTNANDVPFYIYAVLSDDEASWITAISRTPGMTASAATANFGKTGSAVADVEYGMFALGDPTIANYDNGNSCVLIGSFRMTLTTAPGDWTVSALAQNDGPGRFNEETVFTFPKGVYGASANSYFLANGGTAPAWTGAFPMTYMLTRNGYINLVASTAVDPSTDGVGAVNLQMVLPFQPQTVSSIGDAYGKGKYDTTTSTLILGLYATSGVAFATFNFVSSTADGPLTNANMIAAVFLRWQYQMYYPIRKA